MHAAAPISKIYNLPPNVFLFLGMCLRNTLMIRSKLLSNNTSVPRAPLILQFCRLCLSHLRFERALTFGFKTTAPCKIVFLTLLNRQGRHYPVKFELQSSDRPCSRDPRFIQCFWEPKFWLIASSDSNSSASLSGP
ncbi:hypothetical protein JR316_0001348 [Psilocybe cubensis]|uniref:Uncharacterized protein n=2 Tax=Psilocybe cubensis TaxID=181762 RepID=A0ACB8HGX1_PSICU|nr:hypothetical protein JR316_0001348 [Psilocybe cubensis]KAH9487278.1 hypothetical protein JR316_0001348 [Psilocybe cubensis]